MDEIVYSEDHDKNIVGNKYIDIKELDIGHDLERFKRSLEIDEVKLVRKKRNVEKVSDDLLHDFEMNPTDMHGEFIFDCKQKSLKKLDSIYIIFYG